MLQIGASAGLRGNQEKETVKAKQQEPANTKQQGVDRILSVEGLFAIDSPSWIASTTSWHASLEPGTEKGIRLGDESWSALAPAPFFPVSFVLLWWPLFVVGCLNFFLNVPLSYSKGRLGAS